MVLIIYPSLNPRLGTLVPPPIQKGNSLMNNTAPQNDTNCHPVVIYYRTKAGVERTAKGIYHLLNRYIEVRGMNVPSRELDFWLRKTHNAELLMIEVQQSRRRKPLPPKIPQSM